MATTISHVLCYTGPTNLPQTQGLRNQLAYLNQPPQVRGEQRTPTGLLIVLSSWGGSTFEARSLYGWIRTLPYPVEIHAVGVVQSAAVPLMLAADRRTSAPDAKFLFHPWTWGSDAHPGQTAAALQEVPLRLDDEIAWAKSVFLSRTSLNAENLDQMQLLETASIRDTTFALEHGFIHEATERKIPAGVPTWNITG